MPWTPVCMHYKWTIQKTVIFQNVSQMMQVQNNKILKVKYLKWSLQSVSFQIAVTQNKQSFYNHTSTTNTQTYEWKKTSWWVRYKVTLQCLASRRTNNILVYKNVEMSLLGPYFNNLSPWSKAHGASALEACPNPLLLG